MILATGFGFHLVSKSAIDEAHRNAASALASGAKLAIAEQTQQLIQIVQGMAENDDLRNWVKQKNMAQLKIISKNYESILPGAMKIRILFPETAKLDSSEAPHLGYADLDMVNETFKANQKPVIQGDKGPNRHLAIARGVVWDGQVLAVILAALEYDYLKQSLRSVTVNGARVELKQGKTLLASAGVLPEDSIKLEPTKVAGTSWMLQVRTTNPSNTSSLGVYAAILIFASTVIALISVFSFQRMSSYLHSDQRSILKITKDLMSGQMQGNYPVYLDEMQVIISTVSQYKRVIHDHSTIESIAENSGEEELTLNSFFDDDADDKQKASINAVEQANTKPLMPEDFFKEGNTLPVKAAASPLSTNIYQTHEIRGIVDKTLTTDIVHDIGRALGTELKGKGFDSVVVARDGRNSSLALQKALSKGLVSTGINILDIGMVATPVLYFIAHYHESRSGIMITGGHHPQEYNGIKMVIDGEFLSEKEIHQLKQRIETGDFISGGLLGAIEANNMQVNEYIGAIAEDVKIARQMKVVVDCGNGVAGELAPTVLKTLGCEVIEVHCEIDGSFPNHDADPSKRENLKDLITAVGHYTADVGFAFDGDGDRLTVVDCKGNVIWPDKQMMLYAKDVLKLIPGAKIIYDPMCSNQLTDEISKYGGQPIMIKTGHTFLRQAMKREGANLAGEMSGHILFNDRWFGFDDAIYTAARMVEILSADARASSAVFADLPTREHDLNYTLPMTAIDAVKFIARLAELAIFPEGKITCMDCLRVDFADGWGIARPSKSMPGVVLRFEADNKEALIRIRDGFKQYMTDAKPGMKIPF